MAIGKITTRPTLSGTTNKSTIGSVLSGTASAGGGTSDHNRLINRDMSDQHPISAITNLEQILDDKLDSSTALPLIEEATKGKAKGLYFDAAKELNKKAYWYLTSEINPATGQGTKESVISGPYNLGAGGGGGAGGAGITSVSVKPVIWPSTVAVGRDANISINWSSTVGEDKEPTGAGTIYVSVNGKQALVLSNKEQGIVELNLSEYLTAGSNSIQIRILDAYGTIGTLVRTITAVDLKLTSSFDSTSNYPGDINYTYIPYGNVLKTVHFIIDGEEASETQSVRTTGESQTYKITGLTHGSHTLEVYFTANINGETISSNSLFYDLVCYEKGNTTPIIVSTFRDFEQEQYLAFNIPYRVFIDGLYKAEVAFLVDDVEISNTTVDSSEQYWNYLNNTPGNYKLSIKCGDVYKNFIVHIKASEINVTPVTQDLVLALDAKGRNNNEEATRETWVDKASNISCLLTGFNWKSNGWLRDDEGNAVLRVNSGARVNIPFELFAEDFKTMGKTIEFEIATRAVMDYETPLISCLDKTKTKFFSATPSFVSVDTRQNTFRVTFAIDKLANSGLPDGDSIFTYTTDGWTLSNIKVNLSDYGINIAKTQINPDGDYPDTFLFEGDTIVVNCVQEARGFYITPQLATLRSQQSIMSTQYKEEEHVRLTFVIEKDSHTYVTITKDPITGQEQHRETKTRLIWMYINGIASGAAQYPEGDTFNQISPNIITIGSDFATVDIYNIRVYDNNLTSIQVVNNWIADTQNAAVRATRYLRNNNYNDNNKIVISQLPPDLPYIIWDIDPLPEYKGDKRLGNVVFVDPVNLDRSFTSDNAQYNVQGTSSSVYPTKNIRIKFKAKDKDPNFSWVNNDGDTITEFAITEGGIGDNYFTYKVDYASSESANNVELVKLYNDTCKELKILTPPQQQDSRVRLGIDGFPIAAFQRDTDGNDTFVTKANFNNDKANEKVYGFSGKWTDSSKVLWDGDESWETTNNSADEAKYKVPITKDNLFKAFEIRFPDEDGYNKIDKIGPMTAWVASTNANAATNELLKTPVTYPIDSAIISDRNADGLIINTIETVDPNDTSNVITTEISVTFTKDIKDYRLNKFKHELGDWFNIRSTLFYYVFTHLYLMIDSRAKNAFPTYFKTRTNELVTDEEGNSIPNTYTDGGNRWYWLPYDMDTAIGIDNKGKLSFDYSLEDTDTINGADVYNGQDSVIWNNVRVCFASEVASMYDEMRVSKLISYEETEKRFEAHQNQWSENIFNEDAKLKYVAPLPADNYLEMLQGSKAQQRKWWLYNRFKYMDSKYNAGDVVEDFLQFRAYVPSGTEKPSLTITPYADIYATVNYSNGGDARYTVSVKAARNKEVIVPNPFTIEERENDQETYIYSASQLKDIGDLSPFKPDTVKIGNAIRLQSLKVGDKDESYENPHLLELSVGNNILLKSIDARNCINLGTEGEQGRVVTPAPNLSGCTALEEIYFTGTQIKGITLPDGGNIKKLYLPGTLTELTIKNQPALEELVLEGTYYMQKLWLENIPFSLINAEALVRQMQKGSFVTLIGINEDYNTYDEIVDFYNLLKEYKGKDRDGQTTEQALVEGVINIPEISWADYIKLTQMNKNIKINAGTIYCTVKFINNYEGDLYETILERVDVPKGSTISSPVTPNKASSISHSFNFSHWCFKDNTECIWTPETIIEKDTELVAIYSSTIRSYTIKFDTSSDIIRAIPEEALYEYGSTIAEPELIGIPEGVTKIGWFFGAEPWSFIGSDNPTKFEGPFDINSSLTITAKWDDHEKPIIHSIIPENCTKALASATDNLGITAWALTASPESPLESDWKILDNPITRLEQSFEVNAPGIYYFWITDNAGQEICEQVEVFEISYSYKINEDSRITYDHLSADNNTYPFISLLSDKNNIDENSEAKAVTTFALKNSIITYNPILQSNYEGLMVLIQSNSYNIGDEIKVTGNININASCSPKLYDVEFYLGDQGDSSKAPNLEIFYKELINEPVPQYDVNTRSIIDGWYTSLDYNEEGKWDFVTNRVDSHMTLYAKWVKYNSPTKLTIQIPDESDGIVTLRYSQYSAPVRIDWNWTEDSDSNSDDYLASLETSDDYTNVITLTHSYSSPGKYIVAIYGATDTNASYQLGGGNATAATIMPAAYLTHIEFSSDLVGAKPSNITSIYTGNTLQPYAFAGANIEKLTLTRYMQSVSSSCFANCKNLKEVVIPDNITIINSQAFSGSALETLSLHSDLKFLGTHAFASCENLGTVELLFTSSCLVEDNIFYDCTNLSSISFSNTLDTIYEYMFRQCSSIKVLKLPKNILKIKTGAFESCHGLEYIETTANYIGDYAFYNCSNLSKIKLLNKDLNLDIANPGKFIFDKCSKLNTAGPLNSRSSDGAEVDIEFTWSNKLPKYAFSRNYYYTDTFRTSKDNSLNEVVLPMELEEIGDYALVNAVISKIELYDSLKIIGEHAFEGSWLQSVIIPNSVEDIKANAFASCQFLTKIGIKASRSNTLVDTAQNAWFFNCTPDQVLIKIPSSLPLLSDSEPLESAAKRLYGGYWNAYNFNGDTLDWVAVKIEDIKF